MSGTASRQFMLSGPPARRQTVARPPVRILVEAGRETLNGCLRRPTLIQAWALDRRNLDMRTDRASRTTPPIGGRNFRLSGFVIP